MAEVLTVRLGERLAHALEKAAKEAGLPKGEIVRQALQARLEQRGAVRVMSRHFGSVGGPSDLSTNKAYRRAWKRKRA